MENNKLELIKIDVNENQEPVVDGRELHRALEIKTEYKKWFDRMKDYGFTENLDYVRVTQKCHTPGGEQDITNHAIKLDMAKEIAMIQRNEKGKEIRQYFIQVEKDFNSPEKIMARALRLADKQIKTLQVENSQLCVANEIMKPKAEYFDDLVDKNLLTGFRETAKELKVKEKAFVKFLIEHKYIFRDKKGKLQPNANKNNGLFEVKETKNEKTQWVGTQTLITPKGRETFRLLCVGI